MTTKTHYRVEFAVPPVNLIDALVKLAEELGIAIIGRSPD